MNLLKNLSEDELKNKIEELNDPFLSYAYVKELEQRQEAESELKRIAIRLEHGKDYRNRIGERVTVFKFGGSKHFPFADVLGRSYTDSGKVWKERESEYDLVEVV